MQETIYTIALHDAFQQETECPFCLIEENTEKKLLDFLLDQAVMDVRSRGETNREGFCRRHFELLYNRRFNRLQLALILDTHLAARNAKLKKLCAGLAKKAGGGALPRLQAFGAGGGAINACAKLVKDLRDQDEHCFICRKTQEAMEQHIKVTYYLWEKEREFAALFGEKKGFCQKHFRQLLEGAAGNLSSRQWSNFITLLVEQQLTNLDRIQSEVHRFTEKMAYHNEDLPWENARDALLRGIKKLAGYCRLE